MHINLLSLKKFINNYKQTILARYLVSLMRASNSQKSRGEVTKLSALFSLTKKDVSCPYVSEMLLHHCPKIQFTTVFQPQPCSNLFLMFHQISGSCSYRTVLIQIVYSKGLHGQGILIRMVCLLRSTTGEVVQLINISNEEWSALLETVCSMICNVQCPHYITIWPKCHIFARCVSLGYHQEKL